jgi:hypothetical protein
MKFGPDDEDAFYRTRDDLVAAFEATIQQEYGWVASQVLDFKWGYLDGDLAGWSTEDVDEILLGLYPAKVMVDPEDIDTIPVAFAAFLGFLGHKHIVDQPVAAALAQHALDIAPAFRTAARDERNWSMGKRLWAQAAAEDVDIADELSLQRFVSSFNARPFEERDAILDGVTGPAGGGDAWRSLLRPLPPVVLAPQAELDAAAGESRTLRRITRLVEFVGTGRPVTQNGNLKLADGKQLVALLETGDEFDPLRGDQVYKTQSTTDLFELDLVFRVALGAGFLSIVKGKVVPGPLVELPADDLLAAVYGAFLSLVQVVGPTRHRWQNNTHGWDWFAEDVDQYLIPLLMDLYRHGEEPIDDISEDTWDWLNESYDLSDLPPLRATFQHELVDHSLRRALNQLADLGIVRVRDVEEIQHSYGSDEVGGWVELTPLGTWAVQRVASHMTSAPVVGALRFGTATELLEAAADLPTAEANGEIDAWVAEHDGTAAVELAAALADADETGRGLGFRALLRIGPDAAEAVDTLADDPRLAPYVTVWRVDSLTATEDEVDCGDDGERFVRLLYAVIELWGPDAATATWANNAARTIGLPAMLEDIWRVQLPETEEVLSAVAGNYPDKAIAKAARKALFKYRTAH